MSINELSVSPLPSRDKKEMKLWSRQQTLAVLQQPTVLQHIASHCIGLPCCGSDCVRGFTFNEVQTSKGMCLRNELN